MPDADSNNNTTADRLQRARAAAAEFIQHFDLPAQYLEEVSSDLIQAPLTIERNGVPVEIFRWIGHGRGASSIQVEVSHADNVITVYGAFGDREIGPWRPQ